MKEGIHPNYRQTTIRCACGNVIATGSTKKDIMVEICSKCHVLISSTESTVSSNFGYIRFKPVGIYSAGFCRVYTDTMP